MEERIIKITAQAEKDISEIVAEAQKIVDNILKGNNNLVAEIKATMVKGIDMIPLETLQEWAIAIPIIIEDIVSYRESFSLTKELWKIEERRVSARNLLELDLKKTEITQINKMSGTSFKTQEAIADYARGILAGHQEALAVLSISIRKMIDIKRDGFKYG